MTMEMPCADCGVELMPDTPNGSQDWERYMVHDEVWALAGMAPDDGAGWLCIGCLADRLGRPLSGADLAAVFLNLPGCDDDTPRLAALKQSIPGAVFWARIAELEWELRVERGRVLELS